MTVLSIWPGERRLGVRSGEKKEGHDVSCPYGENLDVTREAGMRENDAGNFGELFARAGLERVAAGVKEHVRHVDDEAASGVASLQNGIELIEKLGAKLRFFGFGLRGGLARFFGFGFGGALLRLSGGAIPGGLIGGSLRGLLLN